MGEEQARFMEFTCLPIHLSEQSDSLSVCIFICLTIWLSGCLVLAVAGCIDFSCLQMQCTATNRQIKLSFTTTMFPHLFLLNYITLHLMPFRYRLKARVPVLAYFPVGGEGGRMIRDPFAGPGKEWGTRSTGLKGTDQHHNRYL